MPSPEIVQKGNAVGSGIMAAIAQFDADRPRSQQKRLGFSDLGSCREKMRSTIVGAPETVWSDAAAHEPPMPAFIGTVGGDAIENIVKTYLAEHAGTQQQLELDLGDGIIIRGSSDILLYPSAEPNPFGIPSDCVVDLKGRSELATTRKEGAPEENLIQISGYLVACIQKGILTPNATAHLCYWDRSGSEKVMHVVSLDMQEALDWLEKARRRLADVARVIDEGSTEEGRRSLMDEPTSYCMAIRCFAGETEILTRTGIRHIADVAGTTQRLLVPIRVGSGIGGQGVWVDSDVLALGEQQLRTITLRRGRARKVIRATPEHEWFLIKRNSWQARDAGTVTTDQLVPGDRLRSIRVKGSGFEPNRFAQAQGFVYGDGDRGGLTVHASGGSKVRDVLLPLFGHCGITRRQDEHGVNFRVGGIPSTWKDEPNFAETASFLMSWLSGYFAADGSVSKKGQAVISSASLRSLEAVRSAAAICGVQSSPILMKMRKGTRDYETPLYSVNLRVSDLPIWFFLQQTHRERSNFPHRKNESFRDWVVESVVNVGDVEQVYCAVVPGVEAFTLSDDLVTHNCPFYANCWDGYTPTATIDDPHIADAARRVYEARQDIKAATARVDTAKGELAIRNDEGEFTVGGNAGEFNVQWILKQGRYGITEQLNVTPKKKLPIGKKDPS